MHILACTRRLTCRSVHSCLISCGLFYTGHENRSSYFAYVILREGPCLTSKSSSNGFVFAGHMSISFNLFLSRVESTITYFFFLRLYLSVDFRLGFRSSQTRECQFISSLVVLCFVRLIVSLHIFGLT